MKEKHPRPCTFLILQGLLSEAMTFEPTRAYEGRRRPFAPRDGHGDVSFELRDSKGQVLTRTFPEVRFPAGCRPGSGVGTGLIHCAAAYHPDCASAHLLAYCRELYSAKVGKQPPALCLDVEAGKSDATVFLKATSSDGAHLRYLLLLTREGKRLDVTRHVSMGAPLDLSLFAGRGEARFRVEATEDFRTSFEDSEDFDLPAAQQSGTILRPREGELTRAGDLVTLMGSVCLANGTPIPWDPEVHHWRVDGAPLKDRRKVIACGDLPPGRHTATIYTEGPSGKAIELAQVTWCVEEPCSAQLDYQERLEEFQRQCKKQQRRRFPPAVRSAHAYERTSTQGRLKTSGDCGCS